MKNLKNILLFEQTPEALKAVESGDAIISTGGIRRKGDKGSGFLELAKPAIMSIADFESVFEGKEHALETDNHLRSLESRLSLSEDSLQEIEKIEWLNNALIQKTYLISYEGFRQTLFGIERIINQLSGMERYLRRRDAKDLCEKTQTYINYMRTDAGYLLSEKYSVVNGNIAEHLDMVDSFLKRLLSEIEDTEGDSFFQIQMICSLIKPFAYVVRRYSALFYYENDGKLMPGNYEEWIKTLSSISESVWFRDKLEYNIRLHTTVPFNEKLQISRELRRDISMLISNIEFDRHYIEKHCLEKYLSMEEQICQKIEKNEYYIMGRNTIIFLDSDE